jgi:regulation of enolase protein 1 (concanavalin A-like superfamily)
MISENGRKRMSTSDLTPLFDGHALDPRMSWFCEPPRWSVQAAERCLRIEPAAHTDFWQKTHYGFEADNGHVLSLPIAGDFVLTTHVRFLPAHQYDQAGLMIRLSPDCWLKTSVEYEPDGPNRLGVVVTNGGYSDWSTQDLPSERRDIWLRVRREATDYIVESAIEGAESAEDGRRWTQLRMARLLEDRADAPVAAGLYACSPKEAGFVAEFLLLQLRHGRATADD